MEVEFEFDKVYFGGFIGGVDIPISDTVVDWSIEIIFPRQVFKLQVRSWFLATSH